MGNIFNIQRFCVHDGPGIRTTVFFKGCPLRCRWCHNPEGLELNQGVRIYKERCLGCLSCQKACPADAIEARQNCLYCGACIEECPTGARTLISKEMSVSDVMDIVKKEAPFYGNDGGVTFSGGECTMQSEFLLECLKAAKKAGINTAVDTCGFSSFEIYEQILPYTDLFLYDIKCITPQLHKEHTGVDNAVILENIQKLCQKGAKLWIRVPCIPTFNACDEEISKIGAFIASLPKVEKVELLPYHNFGKGKYETVGITDKGQDITPLTADEKAHFQSLLTSTCR